MSDILQDDLDRLKLRQIVAIMSGGAASFFAAGAALARI